MKMVSFTRENSEEKLGVVLPNGKILDLALAHEYMGLINKVQADPEVTKNLKDIKSFLIGGKRTFINTKFIANHFEARTEDTNAAEGIKFIYDVNMVRILPSITHPGKIIAMGGNFFDGVGALKEEGKGGNNAAEIPVAFIKVTSTLIGAGDKIICPVNVDKLDYELELGIVIGKKAKNVKKTEAYEYIAGYTIMNDISARDIQIKEMEKKLLLLGKNFDTFGPMGPYLVTPEEIKDPQSLSMQLRVNGSIRQDSNTKYMIFKIDELVSYWSQITLEPGDIIMSGSPMGSAWKNGNPSWYLKPGDLIEAEIEGLGVLKNTVKQ